MRIAIPVLVAVTAVAQTPAPESPTFHSATRLVEIDVVARGKGGPATGLAKEDFTLLDNGKPQEISFFAARSVRIAGAASEPSAIPLPVGAVSNRLDRDGEPPANSTVILIDQRNTPQALQAFAIQRIVKFVQMRRKRDRIGIYTFGRESVLRAVQELTDDSDMLSRAALSLKPRDPVYRSQDTTGMSQRAAEGHAAMELISRGTETIHVMGAIARHLASVPGRKSLVWVTTAFPFRNLDLGIDFTPDLERASRELNDANVALYGVEAQGLIGALAGGTAIPNAESRGARSPNQFTMQAGRGGRTTNPPELTTMNMLADLTGGQVFYDKSNGLEDSIQAAIDDGDVTYALGFYPSQATQDGTWHKLRVKVSKPHVSMRYRENYFALRPAAIANERPTLEELLKDSLDATQLAVIVKPEPDQAQPRSYRISVTVDMHNLQLEHEKARWSGELDLSLFVDKSGKVFTKTLKIDIPDDQFAAFLEKGINTIQSIDVADAAENVRVVVQDRATGAAGSVRVPLRGTPP